MNRHCPIISLLVLLICTTAYALQGSMAEDGSNAKAVHLLGITGQGVNVGLVSARNVRSTHLAFNDSNGVHVFNFDYSGSGVCYTGGSVSGHDTWVAGIIASRGWTGHLDDIGAAPGCDVYSARVVDNNSHISNDNNDFIEDALSSLVDTYNCRVIVPPMQLSGTADGSSYYSLMFDYFAYAKDVVFALASGNSSTSITIFGDAYNGITSGALIDEPNDFYLEVGTKSNPGPTVDGRRKPEITCPSSSQTTASIGSDTAYYTTAKTGATSYAIPQTGGIAALLLQYANQSADADDGHNVVIKAVIVNSAFPNIEDKSGNPTYPANPANIWHSQRGYGRIDALMAYQILSAGRISRGTTAITSTAGWAYDTMSAYETQNYLISGNKNERFVLTATWNRAINISKSGVYSVDLPLFKLNLTVKNPSGDSIFYQAGDANNLEKIDLILPADGNYTVSFYNPTSKSRVYGLAFEILPAMTGDFNTDYIVDELDLEQIAYDWLTAGTDTDIIYDENQIVNLRDFAAFAENWMKSDQRYYNP